MTSKTALEGELCIPCKGEDTSTAAEKYCIECQETLCAKCSRIRHNVSVLKEHSIFDMRQGKEVVAGDGQLIRELGELLKCSKHPKKAVFAVCKGDDSLCCTDCVVDTHRHCDNFVDIHHECIKSENESTVKKIKDRLEATVSQIDAMVGARKNNITEIKRKAEAITDKVKEIRSKISILFDAMVQSIGANMKSISKKYAIESDSEVAKLKEISKPLKDYISIIECSLALCSDGQTYIVSRKIEQRMKESNDSLLEVGKNSKKNEIDLKINPALQALLDLNTDNTDMLADVTEETQKMPVPEILQKLPSSNIGVEKVREYDVLPKNTHYWAPEYYGLIYTRYARSSCRMFLVSTRGSFCCSVDNNYKATECFNEEFLTGSPYGLTELKNNVIAVGLPEGKKIVFLSENEDSKRLELLGHIITNFKPKALCGLRNGDIAVAYTEPVGFGILKFRCSFYANHKEKIYFTKDKTGRSLKTFDFMAVDEKRSHIIQPCTQDKAVYCFDFEGNPNFKYTHEDLVFPRGVSISRDGNIFICDQVKSVIHVISFEGRGLHVVREGCPEKPLAIAFDQSGLEFAVSQNDTPWIKVRFFRLA